MIVQTIEKVIVYDDHSDVLLYNHTVVEARGVEPLSENLMI